MLTHIATYRRRLHHILPHVSCPIRRAGCSPLPLPLASSSASWWPHISHRIVVMRRQRKRRERTRPGTHTQHAPTPTAASADAHAPLTLSSSASPHVFCCLRLHNELLLLRRSGRGRGRRILSRRREVSLFSITNARVRIAGRGGRRSGGGTRRGGKRCSRSCCCRGAAAAATTTAASTEPTSVSSCGSPRTSRR